LPREPHRRHGKRVAGGTTFFGGGNNAMTLARYLPDGSLDPTFGSSGVVTTYINGMFAALTLQPDGKLAAAGGSGCDEGICNSFLLKRYTADGALDPTFGTGGTVIAGASSGYFQAAAIAL
jgi:uncharacterized delta-60 repeat protein